MTSKTLSTGLLLDEFPYIRFGNGAQNLVLLTGSDVDNGDAGWFTRQAMRVSLGRFGTVYRVYVLRRRRDMPRGYTTADMAADWTRALRSIGRSHVIGASSGGFAAQYLALQAPELVDRLVLLSTAARLSPEGQRLNQRWIELASAGRWVELYTEMGVEMVQGRLGKGALRGFMRVFGRLFVRAPRYGQDFITILEADLAHDARTLLPALRVPTLVLGGSEDSFFPPSLLNETAALIPGAQLRVYQGEGHKFVKTKRQFEDDVLAFLAPDRAQDIVGAES